MTKSALIGRKTATAICHGCGREFVLLFYLKHKINYCSQSCYWNSTRKMHTKECVFCGKEFSAPNSLAKRGYGLFCGWSCFLQCRELARKTILCKQCGKKITKPPSVVVYTVFCSKKCSDDFKRDYVTRTCKNCHKEFQLPTWETDKGKGTFCSRRCYIKFKGETSIEKIVRDYLTSKSIHFDQEVHIGKYHADFQIRDTNILIECDGSFWHNIPGAKEKDRKREEFLTERGFQTIHLDEWEIKKSQGVCLDKFLKEI